MTACDGASFHTTIGTCAIAWSPRGIRAVQLPERSDTQLVRQLRRKAPGLRLAEPPPAIEQTIGRLGSHLGGESDALGFGDLPLDLDGLPHFTARVYREARRVAPGRTISYAELARRCGSDGAARAVGQAMAHNPLPIIVPCHRVLAADGGMGGFSAHGGLATKLRLLTLEGADLAPVARRAVLTLRRADPRLAAVIRRHGAFPLLERPRRDPFAALVTSIIHQQVSVKAGAAIRRRLELLLGGAPTPERLRQQTPRRLRQAGVSTQKSRYLLDLAHCALDGALPFHRLARMDDAEVIETLTRVKGIGVWSAQMFLIFQLGRLDVLPVDDWGLRRGAQRVFGMKRPPSAVTLRRMARKWVPFRSIASWYLWRAQDGGGLS